MKLLLAVAIGISAGMVYANLSDMLAKRGGSVNRSTIYRWFIEYAPALRKKLRRHQFIRADSSWQLDETYVKVKGKWHYLYRAINKQGETLDFYFSQKRNKNAAYQFLIRCLSGFEQTTLAHSVQKNNNKYLFLIISALS